MYVIIFNGDKRECNWNNENNENNSDIVKDKEGDFI